MNIENQIEAAHRLLNIKAVKLSPEQPFTWTSGRRSPIYCDNRLILSYPLIRTFIKEQFVCLVKEICEDVEVIAGVATGGIPQGVLVAQELNKPFVYVRPEAKSHGMKNQIEGTLYPNQTVVVIEDLISTGKSSLFAVDTLRNAGAIVKGMAAIFTYELDIAKKNFAEKHVELKTITNYSILIETAIKEEYVSKQNLASLNEWRENPEKWSDDRL
ncbi:MAG: orotate phosphoribosyltransferase [Bacteroidales bacterium]